MEIRKSNQNDIDKILSIFDIAREYMASHGNARQWENGYPGREIVESDIKEQDSYVLLDKGRIVGTFSFMIGEEPSYQMIKNGSWSVDKTYGTIHRLASDGTVKGIARSCFDFCAAQIDYIRIDTHKANLAHAVRNSEIWI